MLTFQSITLANQITEIGITARRFSASVLLVKALGGGWTIGDLPGS